MQTVQKTDVKAPSIDFRLETRIAHAIETEWIEKAGRYADGVSDETIAKEFSVAWGVVKQVREKLGWVIKSDPEIEKIQADLKGCRELLEECERNIVRMMKQRGLLS